MNFWAQILIVYNKYTVCNINLLEVYKDIIFFVF